MADELPKQIPTMFPSVDELLGLHPDTNANTDDVDFEPCVIIDTEELNTTATTQSHDIFEKVLQMYRDEEFFSSHPQLKRRLDIECDNLRSLIRMRAADEKAHDAILQAISADNSNASMYRALTEIQKTSMALTTKIQEIIKELGTLVKGYQLEIDFDAASVNSSNSDDTQDNINIFERHRGSKSFIKKMNETLY